MNAGDLRHPIVIQTRSTTVDSFGGQQIAWSNFASLFAAVEPLSGRELLNAQSFRSGVTTRIRARYVPDVSAAMRVVYGARVFEIAAVLNVGERGREMHLICTEGMTQG